MAARKKTASRSRPRAKKAGTAKKASRRSKASGGSTRKKASRKKTTARKTAAKKAPRAKKKIAKKKTTGATGRKRAKTNRRDQKTVDLIHDTATVVHRSINKKAKPDLDFPVRSLGNVTYSQKKGFFEIGKQRKTRTLTVNTVKSFAQTLRMMGLSKELVETNDFATKRDAYYQSKLANVLFSNELARRFAGAGFSSNALHPGGIRTDIMRHSNFVIRLATRLIFKPVSEGAKTPVMLASSQDLAGVSGRYFDDCKEKTPGARALDGELAATIRISTSESP